MYDEYDDGLEGGASLGRKLALGIGVVAIALAAFFAFRAVTNDDDGGASVTPGDSAATTALSADASPSAPDDGTAPDETTEEADATTTPTAGSTEDAGGASSDDGTTTTAAAGATTTAPPAAAPPAPAPTTTAAAVAPPPATYDTLPDGTPAWVTAIYNTNSITLTGAVPDQAAVDRLVALAVANAKEGQADTVDNQLTINPSVPLGVGVRVVELTSIRFPEGSAEVLPPHAMELNRIVNVMNLLPHINALVIGHADQRGDETTNYLISEARADAVTTYIASQGIAPARLASRAVGEADLLTLNNDDAAFELNRRTEFVLFGLLL